MSGYFSPIPQSRPIFASTSGYGSPANYTLMPGQNDINVYVSPYGRYGTESRISQSTGDYGLGFFANSVNQISDYGMPVEYMTRSNNSYYPSEPYVFGPQPVGYFNGANTSYQSIPPLYFPPTSNPYGRQTGLNGYPAWNSWMQNTPFI